MLGLFKKKENDANSTDISKSDVKKFQKEMLAAHNKHREKHGVPPLKLSDEVCKDAQRHAEKLAKTGHLEHSNNHEYGENVGMHYSSATTEYSGTEATNQWYSEVSKYDFCDPRFKSGIGHFTQVVWKGSKELGVGKAITKDGKVIFVANYKPPGNMSGDFDKNVFPEGHKPSKDDDKEKKGLFRKGDSLSKSDIKEFQQDALETHNEYRVKHGVPKLKASDELNKHSQKWAEHLAKTGKFEHSDQRKYGENIAMHYSSESTEYSGKEASDHWYSELRNYDFKKPAFSQGTGHFSQMVWKNSTQFGIGKAITKDKRVVVVASYEPAGNYIGQFPDNVFNRTDGYVPPKPEGVKEVKIVKPVDDCKMQAKDFKAVPDDLKTFRKDALNSHNAYRSTHKAPALKESSELTKMAQEWAEHLATKGLFEHRDSSDTGENIAMHYSSASTSFSGKEATDMWYSEVSKHDFSKQFQPGTGHFTQVVWKGSKEFGIGKAITKEGKVIIVGNYRPPGNMMSKFNENVFKGK
ncbi:uncharacterized protein [Antedon mediterranea]|uniref:uncharacterized protein isoform X2 n=1 Tax=Antedon mediterranea TaxID=105859 RepID=UPI003AF73256